MSRKNNSIVIILLILIVSLVGCKKDNAVFLSLNVTDKSILIEDTFRFVAKVQSLDDIQKEPITWSIVDMKNKNDETNAVASIDQEGLVKGLAEGTAKIKAETKSGQVAMAQIIVEKRPSPSSGMVFAEQERYISISSIVPDTIELTVDESITQYFGLKLSSDNENIINPKLFESKSTDGVYKVVLQKGGSEGTAIITASAGDYSVQTKIHVGVKLYLSFEPINLALGEPSITALSSFTFNIGTSGVIPIHFSANPDDKDHVDNIDFYISLSGKSLFKNVSQRRKGSIIYLDVEVGKEKGDATIQIEALGKKVTAECSVIDKNDIDVTSIKFSDEAKEIETSLRSLALYEMVKVKPLAAAALWPPVWTSSDESIATVNDAGTVFFKKRGTVKITATSKDKSDFCTIKVLLKVENVVFEQGLKTSLFVNETTQWKAQIVANYEDQEGLQTTWKSSDKSVASVNEDGLITAHTVGSTEISLTVKDDLGGEQIIKKELTVVDNANIKIYDLDFTQKVFNYTNQGTSIDVFDPSLPEDDPHYYTFYLKDSTGNPVALNNGNTYSVTAEISRDSYVQFWEFSGDNKAALESGKITVANDKTIIFDLIAKQGGKKITIKGNVRPFN